MINLPLRLCCRLKHAVRGPYVAHAEKEEGHDDEH